MNFSSAEIGNFSRLESLPSHRQGKFLGPLLGFFLASLFPNLAIARLQQGSIKFQYDPLPLIQPNQPPSITIYQTPAPTWAPVTKPPEEFQLEPTGEIQHPLVGSTLHDDVPFPEIISTNIESPAEYLTPPHSQVRKIPVKRAIAPRYLTAYRRNRYNTRRRFPEYSSDYDNYDYLANSRLRNTRRNQGRRPVGFDYDYDYDYDYGKGQKRKQQRRKIKNKNRKESDYYSDGEFDDDVESVTPVVRPRQRQTTTPGTTTDTTTMPTTTMSTNTTPGSTTTTTNTSITTGYGYGPYSGNENISITYGPPSAIKPIYGVPGSAYGTPLSEWTPSYVYESPNTYHSHHPTSYYYRPVSHQTPGTSYGTPSITYGSPNSAYGAPGSSAGSSYSSSVSYGVPSSSSSYGAPGVKPYATQSLSYGPPSTSYGVPSQSYGVPSQSYGTPSQSYGIPSQPVSQSQASQGARATNYQSYQLPFSSWYGRSASHSDIVRRVQDIIRYD